MSNVTIESLKLTLATMQSKQADLINRAAQAEELVAMLMAAQPVDLQSALFQKITEHVTQRSADRSLHQHAILQATVLAVGVVIDLLSSHPVNSMGNNDSGDSANGTATDPVNSMQKALMQLRHIQAEIDRCLNVDEEVKRIRQQLKQQQEPTV